MRPTPVTVGMWLCEAHLGHWKERVIRDVALRPTQVTGERVIRGVSM